MAKQVKIKHLKDEKNTDIGIIRTMIVYRKVPRKTKIGKFLSKLKLIPTNRTIKKEVKVIKLYAKVYKRLEKLSQKKDIKRVPSIKITNGLTKDFLMLRDGVLNKIDTLVFGYIKDDQMVKAVYNVI